MSRQPKYNKATDANQAEIVRLLNEIPGIKCLVIGDPCDLLIGCRGHNFMVEVKRPEVANWDSALTKKQKELRESWPGQWRIASSFEEIMKLLMDSYREKS